MNGTANIEGESARVPDSSRDTSRSALSALPELLTDEQARTCVLNVGERTMADLIGEPWMPTPIMLGPRLRRWPRDELLAAIAQRAPRASKGAEPAQLARARIERMKAGAGRAA